MLSLAFRRAVEKAMRNILIASKAAATSALTLTGSAQDVPGVSLSLVAGTYVFQGVFDFSNGGTLDIGFIAVGELVIGADTQAAQALLQLLAGERSTVTQCWIAILTTTTTCKLQGRKTGGTGSSVANNIHTTLTAIRLS